MRASGQTAKCLSINQPWHVHAIDTRTDVCEVLHLYAQQAARGRVRDRGLRRKHRPGVLCIAAMQAHALHGQQFDYVRGERSVHCSDKSAYV